MKKEPNDVCDVVTALEGNHPEVAVYATDIRDAARTGETSVTVSYSDNATNNYVLELLELYGFRVDQSPAYDNREISW